MRPEKLTHLEEERVEGDSFGKGHPDNGLDQHLTGSTGIPANRFHGFHTDESHPDSGGGTTNGSLKPVSDISFNCGNDNVHVYSVFGLSFLIGFTLPGTR
jgi:hypothetical protein